MDQIPGSDEPLTLKIVPASGPSWRKLRVCWFAYVRSVPSTFIAIRLNVEDVYVFLKDDLSIFSDRSYFVVVASAAVHQN